MSEESNVIEVDFQPNPSGIWPTEYKVLIRPVDVEEATLQGFSALKNSGFRMAENMKDREQFAQMEGILIAVSPVAFNYEQFPEGSAPQPGDRVVYAKYAGFTRKGKDGVEYRIVNDRDVVAVLE
jgi:co-chaperonin GroES (HSP10)